MKIAHNREVTTSVNRRPEIDPDPQPALDIIKGMASTGWIGAATVYNWRSGKVRCPYTVRAAGYELVARKIKRGEVTHLRAVRWLS